MAQDRIAKAKAELVAVQQKANNDDIADLAGNGTSSNVNRQNIEHFARQIEDRHIETNFRKEELDYYLVNLEDQVKQLDKLVEEIIRVQVTINNYLNTTTPGQELIAQVRSIPAVSALISSAQALSKKISDGTGNIDRLIKNISYNEEE